MSKETKKIRVVECPKCNTQIAVPVFSNGSEIMTKESIEEVFSGMAELLARKNRDYTLRDIIGYAVIGLHILKLENNG